MAELAECTRLEIGQGQECPSGVQIPHSPPFLKGLIMEEIWKETEYKGYFISNFGRIKGRTDKILSQHKHLY